MDEFGNVVLKVLKDLEDMGAISIGDDGVVSTVSKPKSRYEQAMETEWFKKMIEDGILPSSKELVETIGGGVFSDTFFISSIIREEHIKRFTFPCFSKEVINDLVVHINGKKCLEVCAGTGWLSKLLHDAGVNIIATDLGTWENNKFDTWKTKFIEVDMIDALKAIDKYSDVEIVIMSWPEYGSPLANLVLNKCLETGKELIYIGEDSGGCTADDTFFETLYEKDLDMEPISDYYVPFDGIHDNIYAINNK
ncbi:MAG: hypothetical protein NC131_15085 [Roseburia sp.]|nr:hypothetical protein [Roseburia sp.]